MAAPPIRPSKPRHGSGGSDVATVTMHYDGWVQLPERIVRSLGLRTGARLEVEQVEGSVLLRATASGRGTAEPATRAEPPNSVIEEHAGGDAGALPGAPTPAEQAAPVEEPAPKPRARGRRKAQARDGE